MPEKRRCPSASAAGISAVLALTALLVILSFGGAAFSQESSESRALKEKIDRAVSSKDFKTALKEVTEYLKLAPKDHWAYQVKGRCLFMLGNYDGAFKSAEKALSLNRSDFVSLTVMGSVYLKKGDADKALASFNKAISINPEYLDARIGAGRAYLRKKLPDKARKEFKAAKEASVHAEPSLYKAIAESYEEAGLLNDATATYREFLQSEPENAEMYYLLGKTYEKKGDGRSLGAYQKAVEFGDKVIVYHEALGDGLARKKDYAGAVKEYEKAVAMGSTSPMIYYRLGLLLFRNGKTEKAVPYLEKAAEKKKDLVNAHLALSSIYLGTKNYSECIAHCREIARCDPKNDTGWYNMACAYAMTGKKKEALDALRKAVELLPSNRKLASEEKSFEKLREMPEFKALTN